MKTNDFALCKENSIALAKEMQKTNIVYGLFTPLTSPDTWDERWRYGTETFTHFWLEEDEDIIETSAEQFGGYTGVHRLPRKDRRYVPVGIYDIKQDIHIPSQDIIRIDWKSMNNRKITVIWPTYPRYLSALRNTSFVFPDCRNQI